MTSQEDAQREQPSAVKAEPASPTKAMPTNYADPKTLTRIRQAARIFLATIEHRTDSDAR
jgi:hypothetical protein